MNLPFRLFQSFTPMAREKIGGCALLAIVLGLMWFLLTFGAP
jgi:hypothetical protein